MKKINFLIAILLFSLCVNAQKVNPNYVGVQIDTIYLFSPFGFVTTIKNNERQTSPEFTQSVRDTLNKLILGQFPAKGIIINDSMLINDFKTQDNIIGTLEKIKKIDNNVFPMVPIGKDLDSIISKYPGRYYGFLYYNGFMNNQIKRSMAASITLMVVTSVLTLGMVTVYMIPLPSVIDATFVVVDKKEHKFLYYSNKVQTKSFSMEVNRHKLVDKILKKYKKTIEATNVK